VGPAQLPLESHTGACVLRSLLSVAISSDAIAGFTGVVTGSVITGGFQFALAWRSDRRNARTTTRLIRAELSELLNDIVFCAQRKRWDKIVQHASEAPVWLKHREDFAEFSRDSTWSVVDTAYSGYSGQVRRIAWDTEQPPDTAATDEQRLAWVSFTAGQMRDGLRALGDDSIGDKRSVELEFISPAGSVFFD
jgi:hypothetical protein